MEKKQIIKYLFACRVLYNTSYHYFDYIENTEIDDLQGRLGEYEIISDKMAFWLLDDKNNGGEQVFTVYNREHIQGLYKDTIRQFYKHIKEVSASENLTITFEHYFLYYMECGWLRQAIYLFNQFVSNLNLEDSLYQSYLDSKLYFFKPMSWLEEQLIDVSKNYLPQDQLATLNQKMEETNQKLTKDWLQLIEEASNKFSPNI